MQQLNQKIYGMTNRLQLVLSYSELGQYVKALVACNEAEASLNAVRAELIENIPRGVQASSNQNRGSEKHAQKD